MKSIVTMAFGAAMVALASAGCVSAPAAHADMQMSASDHKTMGSCMEMSSEDMMKSANCTTMMTKMNMSASDMQTMMTCRKMDPDAMTKDARCAAMMKMHPDTMKMQTPS
jgi:hypothetical protein